MRELLVDFISSLDGYASGEGWPGFWGLDGPEYLAWLGEQPPVTHLMGATTYRLMSGFAAGQVPAGTDEFDAEEQGTLDVLTAAPKVVFSSTAARMRFDETLDIFERRGGAAARDAADRFWNRMSAEDFADYMRICMPLYNPPGTPAAGQAEARQRAILRVDMMRHFSLGEIKTMNALADLARVTCPALVLAGGYDAVTPASCARAVVPAIRVPAPASAAASAGRWRNDVGMAVQLPLGAYPARAL